MHAVFARLLQGLSAAVFLTACIGESIDSASTDIIDQEQVQVSGAGIKGPLAFADAKLFAFDPSFPEFYDKNSPISSTITSQYAEMSGLSSPKKLKPPFILTIGGEHAIDLNTGTAPVISTLVTVVTEDMLQKVRSDYAITQPVYASPLTSLAFNMARNNSTSATDATAFLEKLGQASALIARTFNVDLRTDFDVLRSPLVINEFTNQTAEQETAVHHRAAAEAFAAKVHMSVQSLQSVSAEMFIEMLARDLNDGVVDNASNGNPIGGIDSAFINQNGMKLLIPNTGYLVEDTMALMQDERVLMGTEDSPVFLVESIDFGTASETSDPVLDPAPVLEPDPIVEPDPVVTDPVVTDPVVTDPVVTDPVVTDPVVTDPVVTDPVVEPDPIVEPVPTPDPVPSTTAFPVDLRGTAPEEAWVMVNVNKPADALTASISMTVLDADRPDEGDLTINGNTPIPLFGAAGVSANNATRTVITVSSPASYWNDGDNTVQIQHLLSGGFVIENIDVTFSSMYEPVVSLSTNDLQFGSQPLGGISTTQSVKLTNSGSAPLNISGVSISSDFIQSNDCSNYVPVAGTCSFSIQFVPLTAGEKSGVLTIQSDAESSTTAVALSGSGEDGSAPDPGESVSLLHADFNNRPVGQYAKADIKTDFQFGMNGYNETDSSMDWGSLDIVADPMGTSRDRVLRVKRNAGRAGAGSDSGGMHFRADFEKHEDVYIAYDMYLPENHGWVKIQKNPSLITNTLLLAGHAYGVTPESEGLEAFSATISSSSPPAWSTRGYGAMSAYYYDADAVQRNDFWNTNDPSSQEVIGQYNQPLGYWITVEMRVKMNTVTEEGVSGLKDGLLEVWVTDPGRWSGARKVSSQKHRWRITKTMGIDGIKMQNYYGGSPTDADNKAPKDQYHYYDNFIVSTKPITH